MFVLNRDFINMLMLLGTLVFENTAVCCILIGNSAVYCLMIVIEILWKILVFFGVCCLFNRNDWCSFGEW